jgi:hypothetical protein
VSSREADAFEENQSTSTATMPMNFMNSFQAGNRVKSMPVGVFFREWIIAGGHSVFGRFNPERVNASQTGNNCASAGQFPTPSPVW